MGDAVNQRIALSISHRMYLRDADGRGDACLSDEPECFRSKIQLSDLAFRRCRVVFRGSC